MFYLLLREFNYKTGEYSFNRLTIAQFIDYCDQVYGDKYSVSTVKQAHQELVEKNITLNISRGSYFLNPLIAGGKGRREYSRRMLLRAYSLLLIKKNRNPETDLYPKEKP